MDQDKALRIRLVETFNDRAFLKKLGFTRKDIRRVFGAADWKSMLSPLLPIRERLTCAQALASFRPVLDALAPEPEEGWLRCAYQVALSLLYPQADEVDRKSTRLNSSH